MSTPATPARRWWPRVHLSTLVVMVLAAGVVVGMSFCREQGAQWGWPLVVCESELSAAIRKLRNDFAKPFTTIGEDDDDNVAISQTTPSAGKAGDDISIMNGIQIGEFWVYPLTIVANLLILGLIVSIAATTFETALRRGWFRIHLATLFMLVIAAALLLAVNMRARHHDVVYAKASVWADRRTEYGWPKTVRKDITTVARENDVLIYGSDWSDLLRSSRGSGWQLEKPDALRDWDLRAAAMNLVVASAILIATAALSESIIRRRKPSTTP